VSPLEPPTELALGAGSVWFNAQLMAAFLPAGSFVGFRITSGALEASVPFVFQNGIYVVPPGAEVLLTATLDPPAVPACGSSSIGRDVADDTVQMPKTVTISFKSTGAVVQALDTSSATVYGTSFTLTWNGNAPAAIDNNTNLLIPCSVSIANLDFASVSSKDFVADGTAPVVGSGWVLPIARTTLQALGQAVGAGSLLMGLGSGATVRWRTGRTRCSRHGFCSIC
jgi:hypothetical protein